MLVATCSIIVAIYNKSDLIDCKSRIATVAVLMVTFNKFSNCGDFISVSLIGYDLFEELDFIRWSKNCRFTFSVPGAAFLVHFWSICKIVT